MPPVMPNGWHAGPCARVEKIPLQAPHAGLATERAWLWADSLGGWWLRGWRVRVRDGAKLFHQAHAIELAAKLGDLAIGDAVEDNPRHRHPLAGRRDALELALVGAATGPPLGDSVSLDNDLLHRGVPVGERRPNHSGDSLEILRRPRHRFVDDRIAGHQLVYHREITATPELVHKAMHQCRVRRGLVTCCHDRFLLVDATRRQSPPVFGHDAPSTAPGPYHESGISPPRS